MELKELKTKTVEELKRMCLDNIIQLRDLRFKIASKQLKNVREMRWLKKENAQILTLLQEKKKRT